MRDEIKFSRVLVLIYLFCTITLAGIWVGIFTHYFVWHFYWELEVFIIASVFIMYHYSRIGVLALFGVPAVILTEKYVQITLSGYQIEWGDIVEMNLTIQGTKNPTRCIIFTVRNPDKYNRTLKNAMLRVFYRFTKNDENNFAINLADLRGDNDELYDLIEGYYRKFS